MTGRPVRPNGCLRGLPHESAQVSHFNKISFGVRFLISTFLPNPVAFSCSRNRDGTSLSGADCSGVSHRLDVEQSTPCSPMCVRAVGRRSEPSREHPCAIRPAHPPSRCGSQSFLGVRFRPNRRQANEVVDSRFVPKMSPSGLSFPISTKDLYYLTGNILLGSPQGRTSPTSGTAASH